MAQSRPPCTRAALLHPAPPRPAPRHLAHLLDAHQETGLHDHDRSAGAVRVVEGTLLEDYFTSRDGSIVLETVAHPPGASFSFDATYIHDVRHDGGAPATSIHAYSPALWRMGHYALGPRGLGRTSLTYLDEIAA